MKTKQIILFFLLLAWITPAAFAENDMKIAIVDMNRAINISTEGVKSKKLLEAQFAQTQNFLKQKEVELIKKEQEIQTMAMMTPELKSKKEQELMQLREELRRDLAKAQQDLRNDENRHTGKIFNELIEVVNKISKKKKFDLVLESRISQGILYSKFKTDDLTDQVIDEYNKLNKAK
ncbi:MAG: OmpH family outer membrane protein [Deltaproteobacteria bacterium]|nr:OmpH family outer membrane protein [Deltaproteobacteria bacterium]